MIRRTPRADRALHASQEQHAPPAPQTPQAPQAPTAHKRTLTAIGLTAVLTLALSACHETAKPTSQPPAPPNVTVRTLTPTSIELIDDLSGRLSAVEVAPVLPQVNGIVQKRLFVEGSTVKAGQALYQLDAASYQAVYDTARGTLRAAQATAHAAEITARRYQALLAIKGVSQQDVENYLATAEVDRATVLADQGTLETARVNLARTRILAPISGKIGLSAVTAGALVADDQSTALATIQSIDQMYLDVSRTSAETLRLQKVVAAGQLQPNTAAVTLTTEDGATYAHAGRLMFSDITVSPTTGTVTLRSVFPNPDHALLPGMFVHARFSEGMQQALLVPQNVVTRGSSNSASVLIVDANGKVESRQITADTAYGNAWIVTKGLKAGDRIALDNLQSVSAGMQVTPVQEKAAPAASSSPAANG